MLPEFEDFAGEHSVKGLARRSEGGGGYGLPPLPPTSDFWLESGVLDCEFVDLCFVSLGSVGVCR